MRALRTNESEIELIDSVLRAIWSMYRRRVRYYIVFIGRLLLEYTVRADVRVTTVVSFRHLQIISRQQAALLVPSPLCVVLIQ